MGGQGAEAQEMAWVRAAQRGDKQAFGALVRRHHRLVTGVAYHLCGDAQTAEDIAQDTFLAAWQHLPAFRVEHAVSLRAWLCRIARHRAVDVLRRRRSEDGLDDTWPDPAVSPAAAAQRTATGAAVRAAVLRLPEGAREAIVLREFEGFSYAEIAAAQDVPVGTVMSRLHAARRRLAAELQPLMQMEVTA